MVNEFTQEKFNGGESGVCLRGLTAEIDLVVASKLKIILLREDFDY